MHVERFDEFQPPRGSPPGGCCRSDASGASGAGGGGGGRMAPRGARAGPGAGPGAGAAGGGVCCICLEGFGAGAPGGPERRTACGHSFHLECIRQWSRRSAGCPLCARSLTLVDPGLDGTLERPPKPEFRRGDPSAAAAGEGEGAPAGPLEPWEEEVAMQRALEADVMLQIAQVGGGGAEARVAPAAGGRVGGGCRLGKGLLSELWGLWSSGPKRTRTGLLAAPYPGGRAS